MISKPYLLSKKFTPESLKGHFILCKKKEHVPPSWKCFKHHGWLLGIEPTQELTLVKDTSNQITGWFVGHPLDVKKKVAANLRLPRNSYDAFAPIEAYIDTLVGRYVFIGIHYTGISRVYLDSAGSLSVVYSTKEKILASNTMLIPYHTPDDDHCPHLELISPWTQSRSFNFGLTPRKSIRRLLPNHYLDLQSWSPIRHWPKYSFQATLDIDTTLEQIISILQTTIETTISNFQRPYLSLTAGKDSRSLLACARPWIQDIDCFTWELPDAMAKEDSRIATHLAKTNHFKHFIIPYTESTEEEIQLWLYRTGYSAGEIRGMKIIPSARYLDQMRPHLISLNAEIGRAHLNKPHHKKFTNLQPENIVRRVGQLISEEFLEAAELWLEGVKNHSISTILELAFIEQRLGCWVGVTGYGLAESAFRIPPFSSRILYEKILSLPLQYRQEDLMPKDIIKMTWPELLDHPFAEK